MSTFARPLTLRPPGRLAAGLGAALAAASLLLMLTILAPGAGRDAAPGPTAVAPVAAAPAERAAPAPVRRAADRGERTRPLDSAADSARHRFLMMLYLHATSRDGIWSRR
jgi:hypothetical protein